MHKYLTTLACAVLLQGHAWAADPVRREQVELVQGAPVKTLAGKIKGYATVEYSIAAPANGKFDIRLNSAHPSLYFNVNANGSDEAIFVGSRDGAHFHAGVTGATRYKVTVYLMRNAARKNQTASYQLAIGSGA